VDWSLSNRTYNKNKAHHALYAQLRERYPDMPSAFVQAVRDTAMEAVKATSFKKRPRKKSTSGLRFDRRTMTLRGYQLTLSCIGNRERIILQVPDYFKEIFETWQFKGGILTYTKRNKQFWVRLVFEIDTPSKQQGGKIQGIDRGLYHLAVTSDGKFFSNAKVRATHRRYLYNKRTLQAKGTHSAKRHLKLMSGREKRFSQYVNHVVTKQLALQPDVATFVLEDLSGIRNQRKGRKINKWIGNWPFHQFQTFLAYKAEASGKSIAFVDARRTSRKCSRCGYAARSNRSKSRFLCGRCGFQIHSDLNAAINIRDNYILSSTERSEEQAAVNQPNATGFCLVASYPPRGGSN
jgi:IS605 OrfB family transposase